ncbi:MAG: Omp85 family outer membrane protein [Deltaproteobacteria bacterium]
MPWPLLLALALGAPLPPDMPGDMSAPGNGVAPGPPPSGPVSLGTHPWTFLPVPLVTFDSDNGLGLGLALALFYDDGNHEPYRFSLIAQLLVTTDGVTQDYVKLDYLDLFGSGIRLNAEARLIHEPNASYFGIGNTTQSLAAEPNDYYIYDRTMPALRLEARRGVGHDFYAYAGYLLENAFIQSYGGSLLASSQVEGLQGGLNAPLQVGVAYDSRDFEPWPRRGIYSDLALRAAAPETGSSYSWLGGTFVFRSYHALPFDTVLAERFLGDVMYGDVPFFAEDETGGLEELHGLGGWSTLRGFVKDRFVGDGKLLENVELRKFVLGLRPWKQDVDLGLATFVDVGRVYGESFLDGPAWLLHWDVGAGLRAMLNRNLVIRADVGDSFEGPRIYILFGNLF